MPQWLAFPLEASYALHLPLLQFRFFHWLHYMVASLGQVFCQHPLLAFPSLLPVSSPTHCGDGGKGEGEVGKYFGALQACSATAETLVYYQHVWARNPKHSIKWAAVMWVNTLKHTKYRNTCPFLLILKVVLTVYCCCGNGFYLVCHLCF